MPVGDPGEARRLMRLLQDGVRLQQAGRLADAESCYQAVLRVRPRQPDALHLSGLVALDRGDRATAERAIRAAIAARDDQASYHNSLGVVLLGAGGDDALAAALAAFDEALARDPSYPEAHNNRGNALQRLGRHDEAIAAYRQALALRPGYAEALCNEGRALHLAGRPEAAAERLAQALTLRADYPRAARFLGDSQAELGRRAEAEASYRRALALGDDPAEVQAALAALHERSNRLPDALAAAEAALAAAPGHVRALLAATRAERRLGRAAQGLARLDATPVAAATDEIPGERGEAGEAAALLDFERGMLLDALGRTREAYAAFVAANARMQACQPASEADRAFFPQLIARLGERFTPEWVAGWTPPPPDDAPPPAFLIGFPRSGTTLLEQMLDAHPALQALEEKDAVDVVRRRVAAMPGGYPDELATLDAAAIARLRRCYRDEVARHLGGSPVGLVIDKMPLNTIDAGLILRLFPEAKFLLALRHPCDVVLSGVMQAFKPNAAMVHLTTLESAARFYADVMALWQHYQRVLAPAALEIRYEDLVANPERQARRIIDFLGVAWNDRVLRYREHARARAIATPSYHQVVQPIYRRAVGRWQSYRFALEAVLPVLQPFITAFGYDAPPPPFGEKSTGPVPSP
jgi:tetratricopeptide (TPR) repeat protein